MMLLLFIALLSSAAFVALYEERLGKEKWYIFIAFAIWMILMCGFKPIGMDPDSEVYLEHFEDIDNPYLVILVEFSYLIISQFLKSLVNDVHIVFLFYAILAVSLKFVAIKRICKPFLFLPLVVYIGDIFVLQDMIQIRASVASGLFLLSIKPFSEGNKKQGILLLLSALVFHYSSIVLFVVLFFSNKPIGIKGRWILASLVPIGIALFVLQANILTTLPIPYISNKIEAYQTIKDQGRFDEISLFNVFVWTRIFVFLYVLYFYDTISEKFPYLSLVLKIMGLSIISFFALSSLPIFSERVNELFGIVEILLFPCIYYTIQPRNIAKLHIFVLAFFAMAYRFFYLELFKF